MIVSFWRISIKQTLTDGSLLSDWEDMQIRFETLQDLVKWFGELGDGTPTVDETCLLKTKTDEVETVGRAFFLKEDVADMQDYSALIAKGAVARA